MNRVLPETETCNVEAVRALDVTHGFAELGAYLVEHLGAERCRSYRLVSAGRKLGKRMMEFEVDLEEPMGNGKEPNPRLYIGKIYRHGRGELHFDALSRLRAAGFHPPSPFTVVLPVAYIPEWCLLFQEKAPGRLLTNILFDEPDAPDKALGRSVEWLLKLHAAPIEAPMRLERVLSALVRYGDDLAKALPDQAHRLARLANTALAGLKAPHLTPPVPSHGDFHPANVFIDDSGRVTVIDLDTFGLQERVADVAYFMLQTAIMGYLRLGSFASTARVRHLFLETYLDAVPLPRERVALYMGIGFLQSLHYELCVLRNGKTALVEPWLSNSERCLSDGEVTLIDDTTG